VLTSHFSPSTLPVFVRAPLDMGDPRLNSSIFLLALIEGPRAGSAENPGLSLSLFPSIPSSLIGALGVDDRCPIGKTGTTGKTGPEAGVGAFFSAGKLVISCWRAGEGCPCGKPNPGGTLGVEDRTNESCEVCAECMRERIVLAVCGRRGAGASGGKSSSSEDSVSSGRKWFS
jgi:hypothetical protein